MSINHKYILQIYRECDLSRGEYPHKGKDWYGHNKQDYADGVPWGWFDLIKKHPEYRVVERKIEEKILFL